MKLKKNILLGVASAATQVEGGDKNNSWYDWSEKGFIKDGTSSYRANDHYNRYKEDIDIMVKMNIQVYRMGIEWSRIEPRQNEFDYEAIKHYRDEINYLLEKGIKPLVTLHHFSNPIWFEKIGAFANENYLSIFSNFVKTIVESLSDLVSEYITINEPNVYVTNGYFFGEWPPGFKNFNIAMKVMSNLAVCHIKAYKIIHSIRKSKGYTDTKVSFANHLRIFEPKYKWNPIDLLGTYFIEKAFQSSITLAMNTGKFTFPLKNPLHIKQGKYYDFIGINYYTRSIISFFKNTTKKNVPINDLGWEIYPKGIRILSEKMYAKYNAPIYITENGTCDKNDSFRSKYIYTHLKQLMKAKCPIERYYHWTFTDNFEWTEGESARFGLVHVNFETQERTIKKSGLYYSALIKNRGAGPIDKL